MIVYLLLFFYKKTTFLISASNTLLIFICIFIIISFCCLFAYIGYRMKTNESSNGVNYSDYDNYTITIIKTKLEQGEGITTWQQEQ